MVTFSFYSCPAAHRRGISRKYQPARYSARPWSSACCGDWVTSSRWKSRRRQRRNCRMNPNGGPAGQSGETSEEPFSVFAETATGRLVRLPPSAEKAHWGLDQIVKVIFTNTVWSLVFGTSIPDVDFNPRTEFLLVQRFHQTRQGPSLCYALTCWRSWQGQSLCYWTARGRELLHNQYVFDNRSGQK